MKKDDDLNKVINLIYQTDKYIYSHMCGYDYKYFVKIMNHHLFTDSIFSYKNIIVAKYENDIIGILLSFTNEFTIPSLPTKKEFEIRNCYKIVMTDYFQNLIKSIKSDSLYINNLCVDINFQNNGIGFSLLQYILNNTKRNTIVLDCLEDNLPAIALYKKCGFIITSRFMGYSGEEKKNIYCLTFEKILSKSI